MRAFSLLRLNPSEWITSQIFTRRYTISITTHRLRSPRMPSQHLLSTLNPDLLVAQDFMDVSRLAGVAVRFPNSPNATKGRFCYRFEKDGSRIPFPDHLTGFLYYHRHPHSAPLEGGIRFRVTPDNAPSSFHRGADLLLPSGAPWQITLPQVACRLQNERLCLQLLEEKLVTHQQISWSRKIFGTVQGNRRVIAAEHLLFRLTQEFAIKFTRELQLSVVGPTALHDLRCHLFRTRQRPDFFPFTGSAIARFEPSTSPEYAGRRVVHFRILKIISPVTCLADGYQGLVLKPEEGQLLVHSIHRRPPKPWSYDIDENNTVLAVALRVLWDNSRTV
ncbi:hypothetical protein K438DRAFT_1942224 [Mycena galopus ATCC 62051]|nr:hypothetical protein K438DRAFT_1942224 [Mycena galopus ATCC 62051]